MMCSDLTLACENMAEMTMSSVFVQMVTDVYMYSRQLSNVLRMAVQPLVKFRQFSDVRDASQQGKKKGD